MQTREVSWGDALVVEQFKYPGGLKSAVEKIRAQIGPQIGVRATFQKLLVVADPADLSERDRFRAWCLIATFGCEPGDWDLADDVVPAAFNPAALRTVLAPATLSESSDEDDCARSSTDRASDYGSVARLGLSVPAPAHRAAA